MDYKKAVFILRRFLDDYTDEELAECVIGAYGSGKFDEDRVAPVVKLNDNAYILELWHGPTCAFKDVALQILPRLLVKANRKTRENAETVILVATSGEYGKAALEGFQGCGRDQDHSILPLKRASVRVQKMHDGDTGSRNVYSVAVPGETSMTPRTVLKAIFSDKELAGRMLENGYKFSSSANSINWGRLDTSDRLLLLHMQISLPREIKAVRPSIFTVPTGNFGIYWPPGMPGIWACPLIN